MFLDTRKVLQTKDLQRSFNWEFILPGDVSSVDSIEVSSCIYEVKFGTYNISDLTSLRMGPFQSFATGFPEIGPVYLSFLLPDDGLVYRYFQDWKDKIFDPSGYFYPKSNYVRTAYCYLYDRIGNQKFLFKLTNMFPKSFPAIDLSYERDEVMKTTVEFAVDFIEHP